MAAEWTSNGNQMELSSPRRNSGAVAVVRSRSRGRSVYSSCCFSQSPWSRDLPC